MRWFGKPWNPRLCDPDEEVDIPIGEKCPKCTSHIDEDDQGLVMFHVVDIDFETEQCTVQAEAWHLDCFLKSLLPPDLFKKHLQMNRVSNSGKN